MTISKQLVWITNDKKVGSGKSVLDTFNRRVKTSFNTHTIWKGLRKKDAPYSNKCTLVDSINVPYVVIGK